MFIYIISAIAILFIIRLFTYKPRPASDVLAQQLAMQRKEKEDLEREFWHYPDGPFFTCWNYQAYNARAKAKNGFLLKELTVHSPHPRNIYVLTDAHGRHYGWISYIFTCILPSHDYSKLLLWKNDPGEGVINFSMIDSSALAPLPDFSSGNIPDDKTDWSFNPGATTDFRIGVKPSAEAYSVEIPAQVATYFPEIITIQNVTGLYGDTQYGSDTAIVIIDTQKKNVAVHPQDWFNRQQLDFGYQWLVRARRLPVSKRITVEGMRLGCFILDEANTGLINESGGKLRAGSL